MIIKIDLNKLVVSKDKAGDFILNEAGGDELIKLKEAKTQIKELYDIAKKKLFEAAQEYDPNVKAIDGHKVRVSISGSGAKYLIDETVDDKFVTTKLNPNTDEIDEYYEHQLELPEGVKPNPERGVSVKLTIKDDSNNTESLET